MITGARAGTIRTDIDPAVTATLIGEAAYAIARANPHPWNLPAPSSSS
jgi:hypothetical protein